MWLMLIHDVFPQREDWCDDGSNKTLNDVIIMLKVHSKTKYVGEMCYINNNK